MDNQIIIDPHIQGGKPVIAGTRVPVEIVVGQIAGGVSIEEIMTEYALSRVQIQHALYYASEVLAGETLRIVT